MRDVRLMTTDYRIVGFAIDTFSDFPKGISYGKDDKKLFEKNSHFFFASKDKESTTIPEIGQRVFSGTENPGVVLGMAMEAARQCECEVFVNYKMWRKDWVESAKVRKCFKLKSGDGPVEDYETLGKIFDDTLRNHDYEIIT